jgi:hypothetical protein
MKNSLNMVLVIFVLVVLGCSCPKMDDIQKQIDESAKKTSNSDNVSNTVAKPAKDDGDADSSRITMAQYTQIKNGMSYKDVKDIMGEEGTEVSSSGDGKYKVASYKWEGEGFKFINIVLVGDKVTAKYQANLK